MDLPQLAVEYLRRFLGLTIGGKPSPNATVTTNDDGSVSITIDINAFGTSAGNASSRKANALGNGSSKLLAGPLRLGIGSNASMVKAGQSVACAACASSTSKSGDKIPVSFALNGKTSKSVKSFSIRVDASGCGIKTSKVPRGIKGKLKSNVFYKGKKASTTVTVTN